VRWVDCRSVQDVNRWQVGGVRCGGSIEDLGHFFQGQVCDWSFSMCVSKGYKWSMTDGSECIHIWSWVMVVGVFSCSLDCLQFFFDKLVWCVWVSFL